MRWRKFGRSRKNGLRANGLRPPSIGAAHSTSIAEKHYWWKFGFDRTSSVRTHAPATGISRPGVAVDRRSRDDSRECRLRDYVFLEIAARHVVVSQWRTRKVDTVHFGALELQVSQRLCHNESYENYFTARTTRKHRHMGS